jgi:hypothetical protein
MSYFKDTQGSLHFLSDQDIANGGLRLLPEGYLPITDSDADAIRNPSVTLAQAQTAQITILKAACQSAIVAGFISSALGSAHTYPSDTISQANLSQTASSASGGDLWCAISDEWSFATHTQVQAQQALADFITARNGFQKKFSTLNTKIQEAAKVSEVQTIVW